MSYTVEEADKMYAEWHASGSDRDFVDYFGLTFWELAEIHNAYMIARENKEKK